MTVQYLLNQSLNWFNLRFVEIVLCLISFATEMQKRLISPHLKNGSDGAKKNPP